MNVFFSYSGKRSKEVAEAFADLLKKIVVNVQVNGLETDIAMGNSWRKILLDSASHSNIAVVFVTSENYEKPWFNYELGFLFERIKNIFTVLVDLEFSNLRGPIAQFQAIKIERDSFYKLLEIIYKFTGLPKDEKFFNEMFNQYWPIFLEKANTFNESIKTSNELVKILGNSNINVGKETINIMKEPNKTKNHLPEISSEQAFERIGVAVRQNLDQLKQNTEQARKESSQFFKLTIIFSSIGFIIISAAIILLLTGEITAGIVSSVASIVPEVTALLFFKKDSELRNTIESYHKHVLESQKLLTMIDLSETISDSKERDQMKQKIILRALDIA